jgi:hypothetical protein
VPVLGAGAAATAIAALAFIGGAGDAQAEPGDNGVGRCVSTLLAGGEVPGIGTIRPGSMAAPELVALCKSPPPIIDDGGLDNGEIGD